MSSDQEYYPEDEYPNETDDSGEETFEEVDLEELKGELLAELKGELAQREQQFTWSGGIAGQQEEEPLEDVVARHWAQEQELLETQILKRPLNDVELAGLNHLIEKDPRPIRELWEEYRDMTPTEKMQLRQREIVQEQEDQRLERMFERGEVLPPGSWSDDPDIRRAQMLAYAQAKVAGWIE